MRMYKPLVPNSGNGLSGTFLTSWIASPSKVGMPALALAYQRSYGVSVGTTRYAVGPTFSRRSLRLLCRSRSCGGACVWVTATAKPMAATTARANRTKGRNR